MSVSNNRWGKDIFNGLFVVSLGPHQGVDGQSYLVVRVQRPSTGERTKLQSAGRGRSSSTPETRRTI